MLQKGKRSAILLRMRNKLHKGRTTRERRPPLIIGGEQAHKRRSVSFLGHTKLFISFSSTARFNFFICGQLSCCSSSTKLVQSQSCIKPFEYISDRAKKKKKKKKAASRMFFLPEKLIITLHGLSWFCARWCKLSWCEVVLASLVRGGVSQCSVPITAMVVSIDLVYLEPFLPTPRDRSSPLRPSISTTQKVDFQEIPLPNSYAGKL